MTDRKDKLQSSVRCIRQLLLPFDRVQLKHVALGGDGTGYRLPLRCGYANKTCYIIFG